MRCAKCKTRAVVIERRIQPRTRAMALIAALREVQRDVVRIGRSLIILQVAADARATSQVVVIVDVAVGALPGRYGVHSREREVRQVVVERCVRPRSRVMAILAGLRNARRDVVRIRRSLIVLQMAANASCAGQVEIVVDVAI